MLFRSRLKIDNGAGYIRFVLGLKQDLMADDIEGTIVGLALPLIIAEGALLRVLSPL